MGNVLDYLRWRGDLTLADHPFNLVDNLVLAALANIDLSGIVPDPQDGGSITLAAASAALEQGREGLHDARRLIFVPDALIHEMSRSARFRDAQLSAYVDTTDTSRGVQFAAICVRLDDGSTYIGFRGTDMSIIGWQEDFVMSFDLMPSQRLALEYLRDVVRSTSGVIRVGGHSKGGNLAEFAFGHLTDEERTQVQVAYNNDGPGLGPTVAPPDIGPDDARIVRISPQFAVIGMLFHDAQPDFIVASAGSGLMQHDIMTWQVQGATLCETTALSSRATEINTAIANWLANAPDSQRRQITEALFTALSAGGATLIQDVNRGEFGGVESVLLSLARSRGQLRVPARNAFQVMAAEFVAVDYVGLLKQARPIKLALLGVLGLFFIVVPDLAVQLVAALGIAGVTVLVGVRIASYALRFGKRHRIRWPHILASVVVLALLLGLSTQIGALVVPGNLLLGLGFLIGGWDSGRKGLRVLYSHPRRTPRAVLFFVNALVAILFGIVALTTAGLVLPFYVTQAGQYLLIVALVGLFLATRDQAAENYQRRLSE
ncbi:MAG: DUF2974 domain-containing protein [Propionibacteriaceae bacterium]|nr:DUF2974 domain-containing protein [Propionibacteriaceae bacterium]